MQNRRAGKTIATTFALLAMLAGCSQPAASGRPSAPPSPAGTGGPAETIPAPSLPPSTAWQRALADVDDEGHVSLTAALRLWAIAYGPLPGMEAIDDRSGVEDGTVAIREVMAHRDELTPEQRAAVDRALEIPAGSDIVTVSPIAMGQGQPTSHVVLAAAIPKDQQEVIRGKAASFRDQMAARLGRDFLGDITLVFVVTAEESGAEADAWSDWPGGVFGGCRIRLYAGYAAARPAEQDLVLAHEVFHCFQEDAYRTIEAAANIPRWVMEGQAEWAAVSLVQGPDDWWIPWLRQPQTSLATRSYDAVGFYAQLARSGTDPWSIFDDMWQAGSSNAALVTAAGATSDAFLDSVASGVMLLPNLGDGWTTGGAGMVDSTWAYRAPADLQLGNGGRVRVTAAMLTSDIKAIHTTADMVHFTENGHARLADGVLDSTTIEDAWYCVVGHTCSSECAGEGPAIVLRGTINARFLLAAAGGLSGTTATVEGVKYEAPDECEPPFPGAGGEDSEFCRRYRDYVDWTKQFGVDAEVTQPIAAEIARRFDDMWPVAPDQLKNYVELVWKVYATYAGNPEPVNIPMTGQIGGISQLGVALQTMHEYCGIPWSG